MKGALGNIMKQAQKMQENLQKAQAEIMAMEITGESGGGQQEQRKRRAVQGCQHSVTLTRPGV